MTHSRTTRFLALTLVGLLVPFISLADDESQRQSVERLFQLTQMEQKIDQSVDQVLALQMQQSPALAQHQDVVRRFLEKHIGWTAMKPLLTDMYMTEFTDEELQTMNNFYITPTGQKVIKRVPELVQERNRIAMQRLQENAEELQQELAHQNK